MKVGTVEIIDTMWFSNLTGQVGIILVEDQYDGLKCYIGTSDWANQYDEVHKLEGK